MKRTVRFEVDLSLITHNLKAVQEALVGGPRGRDGFPPRVAAVVKANAYGLGSVPVARELLAAGAHMLAVACLPEALELRRAFPEAEILVMGHTPNEYLSDAAQAGLRVTLFEWDQAAALSAVSVTLGVRTPVHLKIDTGMNRLGIRPDAETAQLIVCMARLPGIFLEGLFTHLALRSQTADEAQFRLFQQVAGAALEAGVSFPLQHVCDSIGMLRHPEFRLEMVRAGAILYGVKPLRAPLGDAIDIRTPFALRARISRVCRIGAGEGTGYDESWQAPAGGAVIATVPVGYADGYPRSLSNRAEALVRGRRARVLGLVMMDQLILDVTGVPGAAAGDEVLLLGRTGSEEVGVLELAKWAGTNRNEIISMVGRRVTRVYFKGGKPVAQCDYLLDPVGREATCSATF